MAEVAAENAVELTERLAVNDIALRYWWQRCLKAERELHKLQHDLGLD